MKYFILLCLFAAAVVTALGESEKVALDAEGDVSSARVKRCAKAGTPCDYLGRPSYTDCCSGMCHQISKEKIGS
ncbi:unnamed protein product, partial [Allacma fusca]